MGLNFTKQSTPSCFLKQISVCSNKEAWATDVDGGVWHYRQEDDEWEWTKVEDINNALMVSATNDGSEVWYLTTNNEVFSWDEELESWGLLPQSKLIKWLSLGNSSLVLTHSRCSHP